MIESGEAESIGWTTCKSAWLVLGESATESSTELGRHEIEACPGDIVTVDDKHEVAVICGEASRDQRESQC